MSIEELDKLKAEAGDIIRSEAWNSIITAIVNLKKEIHSEIVKYATKEELFQRIRNLQRDIENFVLRTLEEKLKPYAKSGSLNSYAKKSWVSTNFVKEETLLEDNIISRKAWN